MILQALVNIPSKFDQTERQFVMLQSEISRVTILAKLDNPEFFK